jgi:hypothetical protein
MFKVVGYHNLLVGFIGKGYSWNFHSSLESICAHLHMWVFVDSTLCWKNFEVNITLCMLKLGIYNYICNILQHIGLHDW